MKQVEVTISDQLILVDQSTSKKYQVVKTDTGFQLIEIINSTTKSGSEMKTCESPEFTVSE